MNILLIFILIFINGLFAMSEIAVVSSRRIRLQNEADKGNKQARLALQMTEQPGRFLSVVQVGITLIGIFNGAIGEASLVSELRPILADVPVIGRYADSLALIVVVLCITLGSLIFGELLPKRIAMHYPEKVAYWVARPMIWLAWIAAPFVWILTKSTDFILRLLGFQHDDAQALTEEDINGILKQGATEGVFEKMEHEIMARASQLDDVAVPAIMTPRNEIHYIDLNRSLEDILQRVADSPYSRFPVCEGGLDNVVGMVDAGTLFANMIRHQPINIRATMRAPVYVPETISTMDLIEDLQENRAEQALVMNEYGEVEGLVTLRDILKVLVGHRLLINEDEKEDVIAYQDGWICDGSLSLDGLREVLQKDIVFPDEEDDDYHTLGGFVMDHLGCIPNPGDAFEWNGLRFEIVMMNRMRIERVFVKVVS